MSVSFLFLLLLHYTLKMRKTGNNSVIRYLLMTSFLIIAIIFSPKIWNRPYPFEKGTLHLPLSSFPKDLDPVTAYNSVSYALLHQIVKPAFAYAYLDNALKLVGHGFTGYHVEQFPDKKVYSFSLPQNAVFNDHPLLEGLSSKITADNYLFQMARMASMRYACPIKPTLREHLPFFEALEQRLLSEPLETISFEGLPGITYTEDTIVLETSKDFLLEHWMTLPFFSPHHRGVERELSQREDKRTWSYFPIGHGDFSLTTFLKDEVIILQSPYATSDHQVSKVYFHADSESLSLLQKFDAGYFDSLSPNVKIIGQIFTDQTLNTYQDYWKEKNLTLYEFEEPVSFYLGFNMRSPTLTKHPERFFQLRREIKEILDWPYFCEQILDGLAFPSQTFVPGQMLADKKSFRQEVSSLDRIFVDKSTLPSLKMLYPKSQSPFAQRFKSWIIESLKAQGIDLIIFERDFADMHDALLDNEHDLFWSGWGADFPDPTNFYMLLYSKNTLVDFGGENLTNFSHQAFDELYENFHDQKAMAMEKLIAQEIPLIPAFHPKSLVLDHQWLKRKEPVAFVTPSWLEYEIDNESKKDYWIKHNKVNKPLLIVLVLLFSFWLYPKKRESR